MENQFRKWGAKS